MVSSMSRACFLALLLAALMLDVASSDDSSGSSGSTGSSGSSGSSDSQDAVIPTVRWCDTENIVNGKAYLDEQCAQGPSEEPSVFCKCPDNLRYCNVETTDDTVQYYCWTEFFAEGLLLGGPPEAYIKVGVSGVQEDEEEEDGEE